MVGNRALKATFNVLDTILLKYATLVTKLEHEVVAHAYHKWKGGRFGGDLPYKPLGWDYGQILFVLRSPSVRHKLWDTGGLLVHYTYEEEKAAVDDFWNLNRLHNDFKHHRD